MTKPPSQQDPESRQDLIAQFQVYMDTITAAEHRRQQMSNIFISLSAAAIASIGLVPQINMVFPALAAFALASIWLAKLRYFQDLAKAKWDTALEIEAKLPMQPFHDEYGRLKEIRRAQNRVFSRLTELERLLPRFIQIASAVYLGYWLLHPYLPAEWQGRFL